MSPKGSTLASRRIKVADEVWIATALLHQEKPDQDDFSVAEIVERARKESLSSRLRPGVYVHAVQHCVANRAPNPGRYRMLFATGRLTRRLFRRGDLFHRNRQEAKIVPAREDIPPAYHALLDWYFSEFEANQPPQDKMDPILGLRGCGKEIWRDEDPDSYVRRLREGWK